MTDNSSCRLEYKKGWYWKERNSSFGGFAGIKHTADKIKRFIPKSIIYVEPFAGLGRTVESKHGQIILNDLSIYSNNYCKKQFPNAVIEKMDFIDCILKYDSEKTFFLIDPPWFHREYKSNLLAFCDRSASKYYADIFKLIKQLKGNWFVLSKNHNPPTAKWDYYKLTVQSDKNVLFGKKAKTLITSNIEIKQQSGDSVS